MNSNPCHSCASPRVIRFRLFYTPISMSEKKKIRVGFVGVGNMGQAAHLRNYAALGDDCEVVAVSDPHYEMAESAARRWAVPKAYRSGAEMLEAEKLDAIVASQQFHRHGVVVKELAPHGIPIFTEKPIALTVNSGREIVRTLEENNTWLMVGYHKRSDLAVEYAVEKIREWKASGKYGELSYIRITMPPGDWIAGGFMDIVRESWKRPGLPPLECDPGPADMDEATSQHYWRFVNFYIHQVNLFRFLLGEDFSLSYADPQGKVLVAHSEGGVPVTLEMDTHRTSIDWQENVFVAFEKAHISIGLDSPLTINRAGSVTVFQDGGGTPTYTTPQFPWVHAMKNQALNFIKAVRGEQPAPCLAPEALKDLEFAREYIRQRHET